MIHKINRIDPQQPCISLHSVQEKEDCKRTYSNSIAIFMSIFAVDIFHGCCCCLWVNITPAWYTGISTSRSDMWGNVMSFYITMLHLIKGINEKWINRLICLWTDKWHLISRPHGWAMRCHLWVFCEKTDHGMRLICTKELHSIAAASFPVFLRSNAHMLEDKTTATFWPLCKFTTAWKLAPGALTTNHCSDN